MAWRCSASGNADLVRNLRKAHDMDTGGTEQGKDMNNILENKPNHA